MERIMTSKITIHRVQPGEARAGCDPTRIQILYKESTTLGGGPNLAYLTGLLDGHGFRVEEGDWISGTPLKYLCVARAGGLVAREEVLGVLAEDQQVDLSNVDRSEGNRGDE